MMISEIRLISDAELDIGFRAPGIGQRPFNFRSIDGLFGQSENNRRKDRLRSGDSSRESSGGQHAQKMFAF